MIAAVLKGQYAMPSRCSSCPVFKPKVEDFVCGIRFAAKCMATGICFGKEDEEFLYKGRKRPNWCPLIEVDGDAVQKKEKA